MKKICNDSSGAFYSLGVFIIVAVTIAIACVIWGFYTGVFSGTDNNNIPLVSLKQENTFVLITGVRNGPVQTSVVEVKMIDKKTGLSVNNLTIHDGGDGEINMGDTITISSISPGSFTVEIIYRDKIVGNCQFNLYT
ncbi:MAG: hypothetical protein KKC68_06755 [Candidatus Thermoplasmatota archaeon]|nr:hypothetical protein [Candidatus Thermoplasmatota archaeon]MBU1941460.1 hypothetical protein [Candidatus Thermoplasmatota archaeon]